jgi:hypothetical protein
MDTAIRGVSYVLTRDSVDWSFEMRERGEDVINEGVMGGRKEGIVHQEG